MSNPHGEHRGAVDNALRAIGELQEAISVVSDRQENTIAAVIMSVGESPTVESGQNVLHFIAEIRNRTDEMYRITEQAKAELERYSSGF